MGFLTGTEMDWFSDAVRLLRDELPSIEVILVSQTSPELASALLRGKVDVAFLRPEREMPDLAFKHLLSEPLVVILPSDHRLAELDAISPREIEGETFVNVSDTAPTLRVVIDSYLEKSGVRIATSHEPASLSMAVSLIASRRGVALLPVYALNFFATISRQSPPGRHCPNHRPGTRLSKGKQRSPPQALSLKNGRFDRSRVEKVR